MLVFSALYKLHAPLANSFLLSAQDHISYVQLVVTFSETLVLTACCFTTALFWPSPPLPLVRVDQYFPCNLSLMWNWLFVQTLLCLHKDLDGTALNPKALRVTTSPCSCGRNTGLGLSERSGDGFEKRE